MKLISDAEINLLRQNARSVVRELGLLNDAYFDIGVTLAERHLLIELNSCLYPTIGEIAERLLLDKSTASRLIAKAVKKGYVKCSSDKNDKRKRFLEFTDLGRAVLNAFEPIAFKQTKEALKTLTAEEIATVYQGIALYAKGLKNSRLKNQMTLTPMSLQDHVGLACLITECNKETEWADIYSTYQQKGFSYVIMKIDSKIIAGAGLSPYQPNQTSCELSKLCIQPDKCHLGFEKLLIDYCIQEAKRLGYDRCYVGGGKEIPFSTDFFQKHGFQLNSKQNKSYLWKAC